MPGLDVFNGNAFSMQSLVGRLQDLPYIPFRIGALGLFEPRSVPTVNVSVEKQGNTLALIMTTARGGPAIQNVKDPRDIRILPTRRIAVEDTIYADEVQGIRAFGSESELDTLQAEVDRRMLRMERNLGLTEEFHRVNAIKGILLDADGSTLTNLFTEFGVTQITEVDWDLDNASPASGALDTKCKAVIRLIEGELGGLPYSGIRTVCSSAFFDNLIAHPEFRASYLNWPDAAQLRSLPGGRMVREVSFGGITFEEYTGNVGGQVYVAADKAHTFPEGVPEMFLSIYAPAEYWDTVNTLGLPRYVRVNPDGNDPDYKRTVRMQSQMLHLNTRPRAVIAGRRT